MKRRPKILVAAAVLAVAAVLAIGTTALTRYIDQRDNQIRQSRQLTGQNHQLLEQILSINSRFDECTLPGPNPPPHTGHPCYDRSLKATSDAILQIDCLAIVQGHLVPEPPVCVEIDKQLRAQGMIP